MKKILIIFNPVAGSRYKKNIKNYFIKHFNKFLPDVAYDWQETSPDFEKQIHDYHLKKYDRIIAIGGDGTIKIISDYLLNNKLDIPIAVIPAGSANVLASSLHIPHTTFGAIKTACLGKEIKIDVGLLNKKYYFIIAVAIGYFQKIISDTPRGLKIHLGFFAYLLNFLKQVKIYSTDFKFKIDGQLYNIRGNTMVIANAMSVFKLQPRTPIDLLDGQLEILISKNRSVFSFMIVLYSFFLGKRKFPSLFKAKGKKISVEFSSVEEKMIQIDGETITADKFEVETVPKKLTIITK